MTFKVEVHVRLYPCVTVMALLLAGCGTAQQAGGYDPNAVRMCIENTTVGYGSVVATVGTTRFRVSPGEEICRNVRMATASGLPIRASTTAGGASGPLRFAFTLPGGTYCWHWRVSTGPTLDVVSCDHAVY